MDGGGFVALHPGLKMAIQVGGMETVGMTAEALCELGGKLIVQRRLEEAVEACRKSISINPKIAESHYNLGIALRELGQLEPAADAYREGISLKPDFAEAQNNLGNCAAHAGEAG